MRIFIVVIALILGLSNIYAGGYVPGVRCEPNNIVSSGDAQLEVVCAKQKGIFNKTDSGYLANDSVFPSIELEIKDKTGKLRKLYLNNSNKLSSREVARIVSEGSFRELEKFISDGLPDWQKKDIQLHQLDLDTTELKHFSTLDDQAPVELYKGSSTKSGLVVQYGEKPSDNSGSLTEHLDRNKYDSLMKEKNSCFRGEIGSDAESLYDALATLASDKRCGGIKEIKVKQTYQTKGLSFGPKCKINLDRVTDIGGGHLTVITDNGKKVGLTWDANHFSNMSVNDWLYGQKNGPSNGHKGFLKQSNIKKWCDINSSNSEQQLPDDINNCVPVGKEKIVEFNPRASSRSFKSIGGSSCKVKHYICEMSIECRSYDKRLNVDPGVYPLVCVTNTPSCPSDPYVCAEDETYSSEVKQFMDERNKQTSGSRAISK
jgi:hypothetical protein